MDDDLAHEHDRLAALFALADAIIAAGFDVFPAAVWLRDDGTVAKAPLTRRGHLDAHRDPQTIRQQLIDPPHRPPSVPDVFEVVVAFVPGSGGCGVLDCDVKHGKAGAEALRTLVAEHGQFYKAVWNSPSGGANILFHKPPGVTYSNTSPWLGIDVRADNGWVVAPGNVCSAGSWRWKVGNFTEAAALPEAMEHELKTADTHGPVASNAETRAFIEASPESSSYDAQRTFGVKLAAFRAATEGSRHGALLDILSWCGGMHALDLRWAIEQVKDAWQELTDGEGREDEVTDVFTWVVGQELRQRAALVPAAPSSVIGVYTPAADDDLMSLVDWRGDEMPMEALVEELIFLGRWLQFAAPAKAGKSSLELFIAIELSEGRDPFDGTACDPIPVLYCDGEMGQRDLEELIRACGHDPVKLTNLSCSTERCRLDTDKGAARLHRRVDALGATLVIVDGLNGFVDPDIPEKDDGLWRRVYEHSVQPLKARDVALVSGDNLGKDTTQGPRGSSVKMDKADAVVRLKRTDQGVRLTSTHTRAGAYLHELDLLAEGFDRSKPIRYWRSQVAGVPPGTKSLSQVLDRLGVPVSMGRPKVRKLLNDAAAAARQAGLDPDEFTAGNDVLAAAIRQRRRATSPDTLFSPQSPGQVAGQVDLPPAGQVARADDEDAS